MGDVVTEDNVFRLIREGKLDDLFDEPSVVDANFFWNGFALVGHGKKTNGYCGKFKHFEGCLRSDLHGQKLGGKSFGGQVVVSKVHMSCNKPSCPVCFMNWAVRRAKAMVSRIEAIAHDFALTKRHNLQIDHVVVSPPKVLCDVDFKVLLKKCYEVLKVRDVHGGILIFHPGRYNKFKFWHWSPHFHVLGFISGGFSRCRLCVSCKGVEACDGMKKRVVRGFIDDGWVVKVKGKRITNFGTLFYQLNHAGYLVDQPRFNIARWFGSCHRHKAKVRKERKVRKCPVCGEGFCRLKYHGHKAINCVKDSDGYSKLDYFDLVENGKIVWTEDKSSRGFGDG